MEQIKNFVKYCLSYLQANPIHAIIVIASAIFIVVAIVLLIMKACKNAKAKNAQETQVEQTSKITETTDTKATEESVTEPAEPESPAETQKEEMKEEPVVEETVTAVAEPVAEETKSEPVEPISKKNIEKKPAAKNATKKTTIEQSAAESATTEKSAAKKKAARYNGKWVVYSIVTEGEEQTEESYFFELLASNGEKLLSSEEYTSYNGAVAGITTYKTNIAKDNFRITPSKKGDYIFKLLSGKNTLLCTGANYPTRVRCENAVESTKRFAETAQLVEGVEELHVTPPAEDETETTVAPDNGYIGKWIVSTSEVEGEAPVYYFELFASNGEKLLSSEEYTTYTGAINGIATHKTNIERGNFRISLTKRGDYIFKLLNGNNQLLCLGEHYKTKRRCESAIESVKRFAKNAPILASSDLAE